MYFYSTPHNSASKTPRHNHRILGERFALIATAYKYLDIGISVRLMSSVEILVGDNKGNQIILLHVTWKIFIEKHAEWLKSWTTAVNRIFIIIDSRSGYRSCKNTWCWYCKIIAWYLFIYETSNIILFLFELEHCVEHTYFWLCQNTHMVNEKFKHFVTILRQNCITDKCYAEKTLRGVYDQNSVIICELLVYAVDNIIYNALHEK